MLHLPFMNKACGTPTDPIIKYVHMCVPVPNVPLSLEQEVDIEMQEDVEMHENDGSSSTDMPRNNKSCNENLSQTTTNDTLTDQGTLHSVETKNIATANDFLNNKLLINLYKARYTVQMHLTVAACNFPQESDHYHAS